jgi:hypothetical protein
VDKSDKKHKSKPRKASVVIPAIGADELKQLQEQLSSVQQRNK